MNQPESNRVLGNIGETNIRTNLSRKGYVVADNDECDKSDLICKKYMNDGNSPSKYFSVQCKYGGNKETSMSLSTITTSGDGNNRTFTKYKRGDFDLFAVDLTPNFGKVLYVPLELVFEQPTHILNIRLLSPRNPSNSPYWSMWDFLSIEKAINYKSGSYRPLFNNIDDNGDCWHSGTAHQLELYIQYKWKLIKDGNCISNAYKTISSIQSSVFKEFQYPMWFRASILENHCFVEYGEEPIISHLEVRSSNSTKIRSDLVKVPDPSTVATVSLFFET